MPSNWLYIDNNFPTFTGEEKVSDQVTTIQNYLYMLVEQLRYTLHNLDLSNMNAAALEKYGKTLTEPIYAELESEKGSLASLAFTAEALSLRLSDAEGNVSALQATADGMGSRVSSAEGSISVLQQTADSLASQIGDANGNISALQQTVNGFQLSVSNGQNSSVISLTSGSTVISSAAITLYGMVTFADLSTSGRTTINGGNITTGTISSITLTSNTIIGGTITGTSIYWGDNGAYGGLVRGYGYDGANYTDVVQMYSNAGIVIEAGTNMRIEVGSALYINTEAARVYVKYNGGYTSLAALIPLLAG